MSEKIEKTEKKASLFQQRAAWEAAEHHRLHGDTPERAALIAQLRQLLNEELLPTLAPLSPEVRERLGYSLNDRCYPAEYGQGELKGMAGQFPTRLEAQNQTYAEQAPRVVTVADPWPTFTVDGLQEYLDWLHAALGTEPGDGPPPRQVWTVSEPARKPKKRRSPDISIAELEQTIRNQELRILELTNKPVVDPEVLAPKDGTVFAIWSTMHFTDGDVLANGSMRCFVGAIGTARGIRGRDGTNTISDTNLKEAGRIPGNLPAQIRTVGIEFLGGDDDDVRTVREQGVLFWDFGQTAIPVAPLNSHLFRWDASGRVGAYRFSAESDALPASAHLIRYGGADGVVLPADTVFAMVLRFGAERCTLSEDLQIRVTLGGRYCGLLEIE